jgi:hypothetical protein
MRAINNRLLPTEYGPARVAGSGEGWTQWEANYLYNASAPDGIGEAVPEPS